MGEVIFARPRWNYDSYVDLYNLITLSGYPLIFADEIDPHSDNTYIVTILNGETENGWAGAAAKIILFDLEWHTDGFTLPAGVSEVFAADAWYCRRLQQHGLPARYVPLGSHPGLNPHPDQHGPMLYDAALLAYMGPPRRQRVAHEMRMHGVRLAPFSAWGDERDAILRQSHAVVNIHQHDHVPGIAAQRIALAAAYRLPVITETLADAGVFNHTHLLTSDHANLAAFAAMWIRRNDARMLEDYGCRLHELLCVTHTFRKNIESAL